MADQDQSEFLLLADVVKRLIAAWEDEAFRRHVRATNGLAVSLVQESVREEPSVADHLDRGDV